MSMDQTQKGESFETTLPLNIFLLYHLRDNPKAFAKWQNQLSSIGCTIELKLDEKMAVVRGFKNKSGETLAGVSVKNIHQILVDLKENYIYQYITEPRQVKKLLQDVPAPSDDLKVYKELGQVVIVGEVKAVIEKLAYLQRILPSYRELPVPDKQYQLIEEAFSQEMLLHYPKVKTSRVGEMVTLEGLDMEVQAGAAKLQQLLQSIQERTVQLPATLLAFMVSSGAVQNYQTRFCRGLRHSVFLEVGSDLVLSSFCSDTMAVAEATIQRELREEVVVLQGDIATSKEFDKLKQHLIKAQNKANQDKLKVEVAFIPASSGNPETKVQLVGYSVDVQKLKETLHDFQMNQLLIQEMLLSQPVQTQKILNLSQPVQTQEILNISQPVQTQEILNISQPVQTQEILNISQPVQTQEILNISQPVQTQEILNLSQPVQTQEILNISQQVQTQEILNISQPVQKEVIDYFSQILDLTGINQSGVSFNTSYDPLPTVLLSGPSCRVKQFQADLNTQLSNFTTDHLVLMEPGVQFYFKSDGEKEKKRIESSCNVLIRKQPQVLNQRTPQLSNCPDDLTPNTMPSASTKTLSKTKLEIRVGNLEDEKVDVLVVPMNPRKLSSFYYGKKLRRAAAQKQRQVHLSLKAKKSPGDVICIDAPPSLNSRKIFFVDCLPFDGLSGCGIQALRDGLRKSFKLCIQEKHQSVALPVMELQATLKFPLQEINLVLSEEINLFGSFGNCGSLSSVRFVINPDYNDSEECYKELYKNLSKNMNYTDIGIFGSLSSDLMNITISVNDRVNLQLVFGSILDETTDAVVNTTDFNDFQADGVCKEILAVAGPAVEVKVRKASVGPGQIFQTKPGLFPCKVLFHVNGEKEPDVIESLVSAIIARCDYLGYKSVAIPAICTGKGGLDPDVVANVILQAIKTSLIAGPMQHLATIRLVVIKMDVFMAFKKIATKMFPSAGFKTVIDEPSSHPPPPVASTLDPSTLCSSSSVQQIAFTIMGLSHGNVAEAIYKLKQLYQAQCRSQSFRQEELDRLPPHERSFLKQLMQVLDVHVEEDTRGQRGWTVRGLKDCVQQVMEVIWQGRNV